LGPNPYTILRQYALTPGLQNPFKERQRIRRLPAAKTTWGENCSEVRGKP